MLRTSSNFFQLRPTNVKKSMLDNLDYSSFDKKIKELDLLLQSTKSLTLQELIERAKDYSYRAIQDVKIIQQLVINYLTNHRKRSEKKLIEYSDKAKSLTIHLQEFKKQPRTVEQTTVVVNLMEAAADTLTATMKNEAKIDELTRKVHITCATAIADALLNHIFKYTSSNFNIDKVTELLNYIVESKIPLLAEAKMISNMPTKVRLKKQAKTTDAMLTYLENYNTTLEQWSHHCADYTKILIKNPADVI